MKSFVNYLLIAIIFVLVGWFANTAYHLPKTPANPISQIKPTPLYKYSIENLSQKSFNPEKIEIGELIKEYPTFSSYKFTMKFSPDFSANLKTTSGVINIPKTGDKFPIIVMFRGYVDQKTYKMGDGTNPSARIFAQNGFVTIAPDFLGYGDSDSEAGDIFESRFQTYITAANVIDSIKSFEKWDGKNIFIWGHSNGGQVALTALEITGVDYPTVLWAPVTKVFPFSILTYLDEADDGGRLIITKLADFEDTYDAGKFALTNYLDKIRAPIELNQGTADTSVPYWWNDSFVKALKNLKIDITYIKYPGANHSFIPTWDKAVVNSILFFKSHLQ